VSNRSVELARNLLGVVSTDKVKQTGVVEICRAFKAAVPTETQTDDIHHDDKHVYIPNTWYQLKKTAGISQKETDENMELLQVCAHCEEFVFDDLVAGMTLTHCGGCNESRDLRKGGHKRQLLVANVPNRYV
jgi:hypothetical protein